MNRIRRHRAARGHAADLDVTPFMNLMIVLVPVLLLSMVFTHTTVIDLDFPNAAADGTAADPESIHLEVVITNAKLVVADGRGGTIRAIPAVAGRHDYRTLSLVMQEVKRRLPEKREITLLLEPDIDYQTLISVMDSVRAYPSVADDQPVQVELFPVISLGDAPITRADGVAALGTPRGARS
jgi:biopolymer transport protein ExbD